MNFDVLTTQYFSHFCKDPEKAIAFLKKQKEKVLVTSLCSNNGRQTYNSRFALFEGENQHRCPSTMSDRHWKP